MTGRVIKRLLTELVLVAAPFVWQRFRQRRRRRTQEENTRRALDARCRGRWSCRGVQTIEPHRHPERI